MAVPNVLGRGGDIASTSPPAGTVVPVGTIVTLNVFDDD